MATSTQQKVPSRQNANNRDRHRSARPIAVEIINSDQTRSFINYCTRPCGRLGSKSKDTHQLLPPSLLLATGVDESMQIMGYLQHRKDKEIRPTTDDDVRQNSNDRRHQSDAEIFNIHAKYTQPICEEIVLESSGNGNEADSLGYGAGGRDDTWSQEEKFT